MDTKFLTMPKLHEGVALAERDKLNRRIDREKLPPASSGMAAYVERHALHGDGQAVRMTVVMPDETTVELDVPLQFFNGLPHVSEDKPDAVNKNLILWHVDEDRRHYGIGQGRLDV